MSLDKEADTASGFRSHTFVKDGPSNDNSEPPGFTYVADGDGTILEYERESWSAFAVQNNAPALVRGDGWNVFSCCSDAETAAVYQLIHSLLHSGKLDSYCFDFRCDSPARTRLFRMTMSRYPYSEGGVLYWAQLLMQRDRPPVRLLGCQPDRQPASVRAVKLCSFCQQVWDPGSATWMDAEDHPAADNARMRIIHGVCGKCHDRVMAPLIRLLGQP